MKMLILYSGVLYPYTIGTSSARCLYAAIILFSIIMLSFHIPCSQNYYLIRISLCCFQAICSFAQSLDWTDEAWSWWMPHFLFVCVISIHILLFQEIGVMLSYLSFSSWPGFPARVCLGRCPCALIEGIRSWSVLSNSWNWVCIGLAYLASAWCFCYLILSYLCSSTSSPVAISA